MLTNISILGSTGSIGTQTLDVLRVHKTNLKTLGLSAGNNLPLLEKQTLTYLPNLISVEKEASAVILAKQLKNKVEVMWGEEGNIAVATLPNTERIVIATPGLPGIKPTLAAIRKKKTIALATKEVLVAAGVVITQEAKKQGVQILPIDSEHSAIFQCLQGRKIEEISRIFLTCSGGPFRGMKGKDLKKVTVEQALNHPSWKMGRKITVDSATLMNKGFEVIEAHWLFGVPFDKIKVIVHPQSVVHSAVEFTDGTIIAQIGPSDMRLPIQYALFYPKKSSTNKFKRFHFDDYPNMTFDHPDIKTFRCLDLAYQAGKSGGTYPAVLSAANDVCVSSFLGGSLPFHRIWPILEKVLEKHKTTNNPDLEDILGADSWSRAEANQLIAKHKMI
ncbi:MAG: 1-deoxy-D-xylulose-5-phosphate reductoisomerase [Candidatus Blackburnbacteria bacterium RIFCSPLOWO2_01_FULL_41_27]|uniref:1-deoxy-D-xylulose 5-phosphate reductoisomerase n=2 Tax=Candidatus Blackburniibacteriota TaxID=1817898 RepID=A0A1G1VAG0_9BACT|nr:MAG: 1-deoxy-D-xylulose-5-phosphate reductoisomerase [Candidatus Blackburnbacteria bacterium RIFCSPHIGHO2_12_FULL_41_13b]OGY14445.1 MAG: 1-deoxy-D-xylulose-5-phosphate reductoisomerase [Candidatus Blackburnbacteria bacterium RIFCSPLOWO2_01_FULL_41_27]